MKRSFRAAALLLSGLFAAWALAAGDQSIEYPKTRKGEQVDDYHGTKVPDPYRWLEDDVRQSAEVKAWVEAQNMLSSAYLNAIPERQTIQKKLTELWNYERYSPPFKIAGRYFYSKNDGLQNQSVLHTQESLDGASRVLIDPNKEKDPGVIAFFR